MESENFLIVAMAEQCIKMIEESENRESDLPQSLHPKHLSWMCFRVLELAEEWTSTKLHRWIGFIQCGMLANHIIDFEEVKTMFEEMKNSYGLTFLDYDLIDHLNPNKYFELEIGGEG